MARVGRKVLDLGPAVDQVGLNVLVDRNGHQLIRGGDQSFSGIKTFGTPPRVENDKFLSDTTAITKRMLLEKTRCLGEIFEETLTVTAQDIVNGYIKLSKDIAPGHAESLEIVYYEGAGDMAVGVDFGYVTEGNGKVNKLQWQGWPLGRPGLVLVGQEIQVKYNVCRPKPHTGKIVWTQHSVPNLSEYLSLCWSPERGLFCAMAQYGDGKSAISPDGINWTNGTLPSAMSWQSICWSSELGLFCIVAYDSTSATSPDGINWTEGALPDGFWWHICWSPELRLFCAVGDNKSAISPDGINWTEGTLPDGRWEFVCWSPELRLFCAVAYNSNKSATSPDGINWTEGTLPDGNWRHICWSSELRLFCAVGHEGKAATSPDGVTWTERTLPAGNWYSVCWSKELGLFCAVGYDKVAISPDGINWTEETLPDGRWDSVCWSPELGLFCAVGNRKSLLGTPE